MKSSHSPIEPAEAYSARAYWTALAEGVPSADTSGFAPVLHPDVPPWFNQLIDKLQFRAIRRALTLADIQPGNRILDVGCGTGRWVRRYQEFGFNAIGVDATPSMLRLARERRTMAPVVAGEAGRLPFSDARFDLVSDITVTQHIPLPLQPEALGEMVRVLKPGGRLVLMELVRGNGVHIFPRSPQEWIEVSTSQGLSLLGWFGQEYLLLDRLFVYATHAIATINGSPGLPSGVCQVPTSRRSPNARRVYWALRRFTAPLSAWADPIAEGICPAKLATHGVFVFRK